MEASLQHFDLQSGLLMYWPSLKLMSGKTRQMCDIRLYFAKTSTSDLCNSSSVKLFEVIEVGLGFAYESPSFSLEFCQGQLKLCIEKVRPRLVVTGWHCYWRSRRRRTKPWTSCEPLRRSLLGAC